MLCDVIREQIEIWIDEIKNIYKMSIKIKILELFLPGYHVLDCIPVTKITNHHTVVILIFLTQTK